MATENVSSSTRTKIKESVREQQEAEFEEKARKLHSKVLGNINHTDYDLFQRSTHGLEDSLRQSAELLIQQDIRWKKRIGGPTISQIKFRPEYWKTFHKEKVLLEDLSYEEMMKTRRTQQFQGTKSTKSISKVSESTKKEAMKTKGTRFARTDLYHNTKSQYFDNHLLGTSNTVTNMTRTHHIIEDPVPVSPVKSTIKSPGKTPASTGIEEGLASPSSLKVFLKGGAMSQAKRAFGFSSLGVATQDCSFIALPPEVQPHTKGGAFALDTRFPYDTGTSSSARPKSGGTGKGSENTLSNAPKQLDLSHGVSFATAKRFTDHNDTMPGPSTYPVPRLFDASTSLLEKRRNFDEIYEKYKDVSEGLNELPREQLAPIVYFGQNCNPLEHVKYGMCCNDPNCCHRTTTEDAIIRRNDLRRLAGFEMLEKKGKHRKSPSDTLTEDLIYSNQLTAALPQALYKMSALYTAAFKNDLSTIRQLVALKVDPNIRQEDTGLTALHIAVLRKNMHAVQILLEGFAGVINLQQVDFQGNTALHLAAMKGFVDIVAVICDDETCDPEAVVNNAKQLARDVVASHECFQYIHLCTLKRQLQDQICVAKMFDTEVQKEETRKQKQKQRLSQSQSLPTLQQQQEQQSVMGLSEIHSTHSLPFLSSYPSMSTMPILHEEELEEEGNEAEEEEEG